MPEFDATMTTGNPYRFRTLVGRFAALTALMAIAGCTTNVSRFQMPDTDLSQVRKLYINPPNDDRNADELQSLIESNLEQRGFEVAARENATSFGLGEYVFDYAADWHWDITWYLIELRVAIYDPDDNTLIAQAQSQQSSLARKSIDVVVERAMASLFNDLQQPEGRK